MQLEQLIKILNECNHKLMKNKIRKILIIDSNTKYAIQVYFKGASNIAPLTIFKEKSDLYDRNTNNNNND